VPPFLPAGGTREFLKELRLRLSTRHPVPSIDMVRVTIVTIIWLVLSAVRVLVALAVAIAKVAGIPRASRVIARLLTRK